ncbi:MAG: DUF5062 family protein [Halofilum sp. (in: g-proteobacteria)]|nr:DUF5062 family protein [Halofilum sp. (in: g-proteobacteria)]
MKKMRNEAELVKEAIRLGMAYGEERGVVEFEPTDSQQDKIEYIYRLLVHDGLIQPLARGDESIPKIKHKLAHWAGRQLPANHPLRS